jgi:hypothetical protein
MAAPYNPPVKNEDFVVYIGLSDATNPTNFKGTPTIAAGDFKVKKDGGAPANLTTLPTVEDTYFVKISLTNTEMNADNVVILGIDQTATKEWADFMLSIPTSV